MRITINNISSSGLGIRSIRCQFSAVLIFLTLLSGWSIQARPQGPTVYVSPEGNDDTAVTGEPGKPFKTLEKASLELRNGYTLELLSGVHSVTPGFPNYVTAIPHGPVPLVLQNLTNVIVRGVGEVEVFGQGPGHFVYVRNCSNIKIENLTFRGDNPPIADLGDDWPQLFSMIYLTGENQSVTVDNCKFLNFGNHAISHLVGPKRSYNMVVSNCYFADGGNANTPKLEEDGAAISGISSGSIITNNIIERCFRGIEIEGADLGFPVTNVLIANNILTNGWHLGIMLFGTGEDINGYRDIEISDNKIVNIRSHPDVPNTGIGYGILIQGAQNLKILRNSIEDIWTGLGIAVYDVKLTSQVLVSSNVLKNITLRGIQVFKMPPPYTSYGISGVEVSYNSITLGQEEAILLNGDNMTVKNNVIKDCTWVYTKAAISVTGASTNITVINNQVLNRDISFADYGIWINPGVTDTVIYGNTFKNMANPGILDQGTRTRILPLLLNISADGPSAKLLISGYPGFEHIVERSVDLSSWQPVSTNNCPKDGVYEVELIKESNSPKETFFKVGLNLTGF